MYADNSNAIRHPWRWPLYALIASWLIPTLALAQSADFSELEKKLWQHPSLLAHQFQSQAARENAQAAYALPDPEFSLGINNLPISDPAFDRFLPTSKAIGVQLKLPSRAGRAAHADEEYARADVIDVMQRAQFAELRARLITLLVERHAVAEQRLLSDARQQKYEELLSVSRSEIDAGQPAYFRLAQIESERAQVTQELARLDGELARIDIQMIDLLGEPVADGLTPPVANNPPATPREFYAAQIAQAQVTVATQSVARAKAAWKPQWGAQLAYQQRTSGRDGQGTDFSGDDWVSGKITVSLPVWASRRQQPKLRAAEAMLAAARSNLAATRRRATATFDTYSAQIAAALESQSALTSQIAAIERQTDAQLNVYESGEGTYAAVLDGELAILRLRADLITHDAKVRVAIAQQQALVTTP